MRRKIGTERISSTTHSKLLERLKSCIEIPDPDAKALKKINSKLRVSLVNNKCFKELNCQNGVKI